MAQSAVRQPKKLLEYDIDLDHDEQLHSSDDENIVLLHHGDLHANTHDNIFAEHHVLTPTIEETYKTKEKDKRTIQENNLILKKRSGALRRKIALHNNKMGIRKARNENNHQSLAMQKLSKFILENEKREHHALMRGETTATMVSDEIVHSFMKPLSQRVKLDRRLWTYADKRRQAVLDSHMEASVFKTEITAKKESCIRIPL